MTESRRASGDGGTVQRIVEISLERPGAKYNAGETVHGHVVLHLPRPIRIKGIKVEVFGGTKVTWDEECTNFKGSSVKTEHKNVELFLHDYVNLDLSKPKTDTDNKLLLCASESLPTTLSTSPEPTRRTSIWDVMNCKNGKEKGSYVIPTGVHKYGFRLPLPFRLPSTFRSKWGAIQYSIKAHLDRDGKTNIENEADFTVVDVIDLNETPDLARPIAGSETFQQTGWCCALGSVSVGVRVARKGYALGDTIPFHVELTNHSKIKARDPRVALVQHISFRSSQGLRKQNNILVSINKQAINPGHTAVWDKDKLTVPSNAIPTCTHLKSLQIKYTLSVLLGSNFSIPINITIGTIFFRRETLVKFYHQVGLNSTYLPNYSPNPSLRSSRISMAPPFDRSPVAKLRRERESTPNKTGTPKSSRKSSMSSLGSDQKPLSSRGNLSRSSITEEKPVENGSGSKTEECSQKSNKNKHYSGLPEITVVNY